MEAERDNRIISELTEARKVNEINVDQGATTIKLDTGDWNKVGLFIAITGLMIAAITMLVAITTWLYQNLVTDDAFIEELFTVIRQHSILTIIILLLFILFLGTPLMWFNWQSRRITRNTHDEQSFSSRIYDYSSIRHPLADGASKPQFESIIQNWRDSMPSIINPRNTKVPCRKYDYFTEIPTSGVQKYQYSFRSR
jgi:hypothetical protein